MKTLKASEVKEPGWYRCRYPNDSMEMLEISFSEGHAYIQRDDRRQPIAANIGEFLGPIDLDKLGAPAVLNFNNYARVRLTPSGKKIWAAHVAKVNAFRLQKDIPLKFTGQEDEVKLQIWELFAAFREAPWMLGKEPPFGMDVEIL